MPYTGAFSVLALNYSSSFQDDQTVISKRNVSVVFFLISHTFNLSLQT